MLFNSYEFIFGFLPITLIGFFAFGRLSQSWAIRWLILASLFFYAWWRPINVLIIGPSILINYGLSRVLLKWSDDERKQNVAKALLVAGILFNLAFLGYFKYVNFLRGTINDVFGANLILTHLILPLGISFITFQKIAFLVDVQAGRVKSFTFQDYCTFVLFFPQLIAGPIVHYREMMPQFQTATARPDGQNFAVGLTLFFFGLFKKLVLADSIGPWVTDLFHLAETNRLSFFVSWLGAIGFTLQIYFDFSGYSDMALGLARLFGIKLPMNFNSPLRATSIIDFWLRWHITLTRFLTAYLYNPLVLSMTRKRAAKGKAGFGGRNTTFGAFVTLLALPTVFTMFISGLWHGAGYQYLLWGMLHGVFLSINHAWRLLRPKFWPDNVSYKRIMTPVGFVLTFFSVVAAMVLFRSASVPTAIGLLKGMVGLNGVTIPLAIYDRLGPLAGILHAMGITSEWFSGKAFMSLALWSILLLAIAWGTPNTLQMLSRYEPALGVKPRLADGTSGWLGRLTWTPSPAWAIGLSIMAAAGILALGQLSEFLYWQF